MSIYDDAMPGMKPGEVVERLVEGHNFRITATRDTAVNSGRRRYVVECTTCKENVHPMTTGPEQQMQFHLREHGAGREVFISGEPVLARGTDRGNFEIEDIEARLKLLRAASRPSEPLDETPLAAAMTGVAGAVLSDEARSAALLLRRATAQGHILSAITQLERRRAELLGTVKP